MILNSTCLKKLKSHILFGHTILLQQQKYKLKRYADFQKSQDLESAKKPKVKRSCFIRAAILTNKNFGSQKKMKK